MNRKIISAAVCAVGVLSNAALGVDVPARIAEYSGGKAGAFLLYYDDGCVSVLENAVPTLTAAQAPATFYLIPEAPWFRARRADWEKVLQANSFLAVGNHTLRHCGAATLDGCAAEIRRGDAAVRALAGVRPGKLLSFAKPGGVKWGASKAAMADILSEVGNIERPSQDWGVGGRDVKTFADAADQIQRAENGGVGIILFHGVGGDWFAFPAEEHKKLIAALTANQRIWLTTPIRLFQYQTEREAARLDVRRADDKLELSLTCGTDPAVYTEPLTLQVAVPELWREVVVHESDDRILPVEIPGRLQFDVPAVSGKITIEKRR